MELGRGYVNHGVGWRGGEDCNRLHIKIQHGRSANNSANPAINNAGVVSENIHSLISLSLPKALIRTIGLVASSAGFAPVM